MRDIPCYILSSMTHMIFHDSCDILWCLGYSIIGVISHVTQWIRNSMFHVIQYSMIPVIFNDVCHIFVAVTLSTCNWPLIFITRGYRPPRSLTRPPALSPSPTPSPCQWQDGKLHIRTHTRHIQSGYWQEINLSITCSLWSPDDGVRLYSPELYIINLRPGI